MINVSKAVKDACKSDHNIHKEYIVIDGQKIVIRARESATAYTNNTFIGTFNMKTLEFETENKTRFLKKEFDYYKQINNESFKIGRFIVTDVKNNDSTEMIKVTATDYGLKFAVPYESSLDYSSNKVTLYEVLKECCVRAGVELENQTITNGNFIVDSNQFRNGELIGDVVSAIAGTSCDFATITEDDKLRLILKNNTDEVIEDYVELLDKRDTHPFTTVVIGNKNIQGQEAIRRDQALIDLYGEKILTINDNPFAFTYEKREALVDGIFNKIKGFGYSSFKTDYAYKPYLSLGDLIKFKTKDGKLVNSIILKYEYDYDKCIFEAPSMTSSAVNYKREQTPLEIARGTQIIVNQQERTINALVVGTEKNSTDINNNYQDLLGRFEGTASDDELQKFQESMQAQMDANKLEISNVNKAIINGVEKVVTTTGTFDNKGLTMDRTGAKTSALINELGVDVKDKQGSGDDLLFAGYVDKNKAQENKRLKDYEGQTVTFTKNIIVDNYLTVGKHSRIEDYEDGTGVFYLE